MTPIRALVLAALIVAGCGDDDASSNSPDAAATDAASTPDGAIRTDGGVADAAIGPAQNLGIPCPDGTCPAGELCKGADLDGDTVIDTGWFCSIACGEGDAGPDDAVCALGFPGPGTPACLLSGRDGSLCGVGCDTVTAPECPSGSECIDLSPDDTASTAGVCAPPLVTP